MPGAYPLSPMQAGMLYQSLLADGSSQRAGFDIEQVHIQVAEALQAELLQQAWTEIARRYEILSSCFAWKGVPEPQQAPQPDVQVPLEVCDWCDQDTDQLRAAFLAADRIRGFDLTRAPLMRVTLARVAAGYELFWTLHHIIADGRSFARILHEVFSVYAAYQRGQIPAKSAEPLRYADYIGWLHRRDHQVSLDFFKNMLAGKSVPTPLPLAAPVAKPLAAQGYGTLYRILDAAVYRQLAALAQQHGTTMGGMLQVAWGLLLARLTGDHDVVFGITRSCRYSALNGAAETMVGLLINTLPARMRIDEAMEVGALLQQARQQWLAQRHHDQTPLIDVQSQSELAPGVALFDTLLMYDNRELNQVLQELDPTWRARPCHVYEQPSTALTLIAADNGALEFKLLYDRRRFSDSVAERLLNYLLTTLASVCHARVVSEVEVLPAVERTQLLYTWNDTQRPFAQDLLIHQLFEMQVDLRPNAVAVEWRERVYTFAEIELRANRLAYALRQRGVQPGQYVGICLERSVDLVVALLGVAKSGAAYVPIDPAYPAERIHFMVRDTAATVVISEAPYAAQLQCATLLMNSEEVANAPFTRLASIAQASDTCYAIYTSGSTGAPKGVVLTHRAVVNTLEWVSRSFEVGPSDRLLFVTSPCFDLSVYDVFGVLGAGGTVVVAGTDILQEPRLLLRCLNERRITIWDSAPAALQRLTPLFPARGSRHLRLVMLSGDWIPLSLPKQVHKSFANARVMSLGGATEAAIWSNWFAVRDIDPEWNSIPYGRPIQNAQYYVLDKRLQPVPVGVSGDLYIAGVCLAQGYLHRPELTAERFIANPFRPGERMYATGDLARYFADGELEFLGRADFQVKIRGYRIELGEIEAALLAIAGIREAVCSACDDAAGNKALVAYLTAMQGHMIDVELVRQELRKSLPDFMVPTQMLVLDAMPVSANGKLERSALPAPQAVQAINAIPPRTVAEQRMAKLWCKLLKRDRVNVGDNFFALGGDSLSAVALVVEIEKEFGIEFQLARVLEHPTLAALTTSLQKRSARDQHVVSLHTQGTAPPLVLFCGVGGFGFFFNDLATQLGPQQPVHIVHALGADNDSERTDHSIEQQAAIYEAEILAVCPGATLMLGGYSFGALVAYEMARRLQRHGKQVILLVSFDGPAPGHPRLLPLTARIRKHVSDWRRLRGAARRQYLRERLANMVRRLRPLELDARLTPAGLDPVMEQRLRRVGAGLSRARDGYQPKGSLTAELLLVKTEVPLQWPGCETDAVYGWREFVAGQISTLTVPGSHVEFFNVANNARISGAIDARLAQLTR